MADQNSDLLSNVSPSAIWGANSKGVGGKAITADYFRQLLSNIEEAGIPAGADGVYGVSRAVPSYNGPLATVRRASDSTTIDLYPTENGIIDVFALANFLASTTGFWVTIYDQSGNGRHATQATAANQPQVVLAASGVIPSIKATGTQSLVITNMPLTVAGTWSSVIRPTALQATTLMGIVLGGVPGVGITLLSNAGINPKVSDGTSTASGTDVVYMAGELLILTTKWDAKKVYQLHSGGGQNFNAGNYASFNPTTTVASFPLIAAGYNGELFFAAFYPRRMNKSGTARLELYEAKSYGVALMDATIACDGHSLTLGTGATGPTTTTYPARLAAMFAAAGKKVFVRNQGVGGQTIQYLDENKETPFSDPYGSGASPSICILWDATNSIANGNTGAVCWAAKKLVCQKRRAAGHKVFVVTEIDRQSVGMNRTELAAYNALVRAECHLVADGMIDLAALPELSDATNTTFFQPDLTHLTDAGYIVAATAIFAGVVDYVGIYFV